MYERLNNGIEPEDRKGTRALRALEEFESLNMSEKYITFMKHRILLLYLK